MPNPKKPLRLHKLQGNRKRDENAYKTKLSKYDTAFLRGESALYVSSSDVLWIKFFPTTGELMVQFIHQNGFPYVYASDKGEAEMFARALSKGTFVHNYLIGRGFERKPASYRPGDYEYWKGGNILPDEEIELEDFEE